MLSPGPRSVDSRALRSFRSWLRVMNWHRLHPPQFFVQVGRENLLEAPATHPVAPALGGSPCMAPRGSQGRADPGSCEQTQTASLPDHGASWESLSRPASVARRAGVRRPSSHSRGAGTGVPRELRAWSPRRRAEHCGKIRYSDGLKSQEAHTENKSSHCVPAADVVRWLLCEPLLRKAFQNFLDGLGTLLSSKCLVLTAKLVLAVVGLGLQKSVKGGIEVSEPSATYRQLPPPRRPLGGLFSGCLHTSVHAWTHTDA